VAFRCPTGLLRFPTTHRKNLKPQRTQRTRKERGERLRHHLTASRNSGRVCFLRAGQLFLNNRCVLRNDDWGKSWNGQRQHLKKSASTAKLTPTPAPSCKAFLRSSQFSTSPRMICAMRSAACPSQRDMRQVCTVSSCADSEFLAMISFAAARSRRRSLPTS